MKQPKRGRGLVLYSRAGLNIHAIIEELAPFLLQRWAFFDRFGAAFLSEDRRRILASDKSTLISEAWRASEFKLLMRIYLSLLVLKINYRFSKGDGRILKHYK